MTTLPCYRSDREYESPLNVYRVARGFTHNELADRAKTNITTTTSLANGTISPLYERGVKAGTVKPAAERIAEVLGVTIEELFPRYFCQIKKPADGFTNEQVAEISMGDMPPDQYKTLLSKEFWVWVERVLSKTSARDKDRLFNIVFMGATGHSLKSISSLYNITRSRCYQIETKGWRLLRGHTKTCPAEVGDFI